MLKAEGCWMLAESHHAVRDRLTFATTYWFIPPKNPHWFGLWIFWNFCKQKGCVTYTYRILLESLTWWLLNGIITLRKWGGISFDASLIFVAGQIWWCCSCWRWDKCFWSDVGLVSQVCQSYTFSFPDATCVSLWSQIKEMKLILEWKWFIEGQTSLLSHVSSFHFLLPSIAHVKRVCIWRWCVWMQ